MKFTCVPAISKSSFRKEGDRRRRKEKKLVVVPQKKKKGKQQTTKLKKGLGKIDVSISLSLFLSSVCVSVSVCVCACNIRMASEEDCRCLVIYFTPALPIFLFFSFTKRPLTLSLSSRFLLPIISPRAPTVETALFYIF